MSKRKEYTVDKNEDYIEHEELYVALYSCPKCKEHIMADDKFCSNCGVKLIWV